MHIHNELTPRQYLFMDPFDDVMTEKTFFLIQNLNFSGGIKSLNMSIGTADISRFLSRT